MLAGASVTREARAAADQAVGGRLSGGYEAVMPESSETEPVEKLTKAGAKAELKGLAEAIRLADAAYYQEDTPTLTDTQYDKLRQRLLPIEARFPDLKQADSPSDAVGVALTSGFKTVSHLKPMLSLDNIFRMRTSFRYTVQLRIATTVLPRPADRVSARHSRPWPRGAAHRPLAVTARRRRWTTPLPLPRRPIDHSEHHKILSSACPATN